MNEWEHLQSEVSRWRYKLLKRPTTFERFSKKTQKKVNEFIPNRVHEFITESIKKMVQVVLLGNEYVTKPFHEPVSFAEREQKVLAAKEKYKKLAIVEGAGTGAGGILLGLSDFPLLLSIKMKFLFETAALYGFDTRDQKERLFLLYVFQLAFSSQEHRARTLQMIEEWEEKKEEITDVDWYVFQQEYRDYIDFVKLLQLVPGFGAIVGAVANKQLLDHLGETAMNAYRIRWVQQLQK
jgi:hypothetical protein